MTKLGDTPLYMCAVKPDTFSACSAIFPHRSLATGLGLGGVISPGTERGSASPLPRVLTGLCLPSCGTLMQVGQPQARNSVAGGFHTPAPVTPALNSFMWSAISFLVFWKSPFPKALCPV